MKEKRRKKEKKREGKEDRRKREKEKEKKRRRRKRKREKEEEREEEKRRRKERKRRRKEEERREKGEKKEKKRERKGKKRKKEKEKEGKKKEGKRKKEKEREERRRKEKKEEEEKEKRKKCGKDRRGGRGRSSAARRAGVISTAIPPVRRLLHSQAPGGPGPRLNGPVRCDGERSRWAASWWTSSYAREGTKTASRARCRTIRLARAWLAVWKLSGGKRCFGPPSRAGRIYIVPHLAQRGLPCRPRRFIGTDWAGRPLRIRTKDRLAGEQTDPRRAGLTGTVEEATTCARTQILSRPGGRARPLPQHPRAHHVRARARTSVKTRATTLPWLGASDAEWPEAQDRAARRVR
jgi:hypothetical protein